MENIEYVYTIGMTEEEIADTLQREETAVLSLAEDGVAYAVPISYHYDGSTIYLRLGDDDHSEKLAFLASTDQACLLLYGVDDEGSWSILVRGGLVEVTEDADFDAAAINEHFDEFRVFDEAIDEVELRLFVLDVDSITGRRTTA